MQQSFSNCSWLAVVYENFEFFILRLLYYSFLGFLYITTDLHLLLFHCWSNLSLLDPQMGVCHLHQHCLPFCLRSLSLCLYTNLCLFLALLPLFRVPWNSETVKTCSFVSSLVWRTIDQIVGGSSWRLSKETVLLFFNWYRKQQCRLFVSVSLVAPLLCLFLCNEVDIVAKEQRRLSCAIHVGITLLVLFFPRCSFVGTETRKDTWYVVLQVISRTTEHIHECICMSSL